MAWGYDATYQLTSEVRASDSDLDWDTFTLDQWMTMTLDQWMTFELECAAEYNLANTYDPVGNRLL